MVLPRICFFQYLLAFESFTSSTHLFLQSLSKFPTLFTCITKNMGRRAKNKQGDPSPLTEVTADNGASGRLSEKKLGKRKADVEEDVLTKRPSKKVKETEGKKGAKDVKVEKKKSGKEKTGKTKKSKKVTVEEGEDDEMVVEEGEGSEGWEDVDDDDDLKTQAK